MPKITLNLTNEQIDTLISVLNDQEFSSKLEALQAQNCGELHLSKQFFEMANYYQKLRDILSATRNEQTGTPGAKRHEKK